MSFNSDSPDDRPARQPWSARRRLFLFRGAGATTFAATLASRPAFGHVVDDGPGPLSALCSPTGSQGSGSSKPSRGYHCDHWCTDIHNWSGINCHATFAELQFPSGCGVSENTTLRSALIGVYEKTKGPSNPPKGYEGSYWSCNEGAFVNSLEACIACGLLNSAANSAAFGYTISEFNAACKQVLTAGTKCATKAGVESAVCSLLSEICQTGRESMVGGWNSCWDNHYYPGK